MSTGDKASVFRTTKVRTKLKGDSSWLQRRSEPEEPESENKEEKPWVAEVRASRVNGAPTETSPVQSPTKPTPPPNKPNTEKAPTSGFLIRGVFTKLDKPTSTPTYNGYRGTTQFSKPSENYKKIAPHTVRPTSTPENQEGQLSKEEQEKRTEAASGVLRKSSARQRSYVLSAAKKFEAKDEAPDTKTSPAFVAKRVEITDDDESPAAAAPASTPPASPAVPATSVSSLPQPKPRKMSDTSVKPAVAVKEPVPPKVEEKKEEEKAAPEPVKEDPAPVSVEKDPFEHMKPGCTKVATPLPELITDCVQAVSTEPEPEPEPDVSGKTDEPLVELTPELPTPASPTPAPPAPAAPESPPLVPLTPVSPVKKSPAPLPLTPVSPVKESPGPLPLTPMSPVKKSPAPLPLTPVSPVKESPPPVPLTPMSPVKKSPAPVPLTPVSPVKESPAPVPLTPVSPVKESPAPLPLTPVKESPAPVPLTPVSPVKESPAPLPLTPVKESPPPVPLTPVSPVKESPPPVPLTPVSPVKESPAPVPFIPVPAIREITVNKEPEPEPEPEPSPKPRSGIDTLSALSDTLISFDTNSTSRKDDEPALAAEEGGSADGRTGESGVEQEPEPELSNGVPVTEDLLALSDGPEVPAEPVPPPSPGRWSQDLLGGLESESKPAKTNGALDLLADDIIVVNSEARSLSMQQEEEEQTDETAKETQSPTETVTITTKTVIITDKSEDSADPPSSRVTTTVTESSSADPFDPYPIGTTSPNSSSDLLQPLSDISINRASPAFTEKKEPTPETNMSSNALESLADDVIPIDTDTTRLSSLSTRRSWARTWETSTPQQSNTEESQDTKPEGQAEDQKMMIMFERKSKENDSPWDRWTSPTVYVTTEDDEEEEEEEEGESPEDTQTQTVTTTNTIREIHREPEPAMDRYETYSRTVVEEDERVRTPEPEGKKGFVYVKEYVNATELALHNARDPSDRSLDYLTSSSTSYNYSNPSSYSSGSQSSTCTYCGKLVGDDAKISIEHLNINCHPACFKCGVCSKPMGDLLDSMFLHGGQVNCESCYSKAFE